MRKYFIFSVVMMTLLQGFGQKKYQYSADLTRLDNDQLKVNLITPRIDTDSVVFSFPKIIPGTYRNSDFGKFISGVEAFSKSGKSLSVRRLNDNQWSIQEAKSLYKLSYLVDDIFDTDIRHTIYPMSATNFEAGKNVIINTPGIFGFFEGMTKLPFELSLQKPANYYGATSLKPVKSTPELDQFRVNNVDALYDAPMIYSVPDTATIRVGNASVLIAVVSPGKKITAAQIAEWMRGLVTAAYKFLGNKLPVDKYAFLYYFRSMNERHSFPPGSGGALEHNTSSFYYLFESPFSMSESNVVDISSHEFFHIITPLTVASREVKEFNWSKTTLSKHLWLYEGVTEYTAHLVQVAEKLNSVEEFLSKMGGKISNSQAAYRDTLPFTELSKHSADTYAGQYNNVYQKGALIAMCLDIELLKWSDGKFGLRELMEKLGKRYGKEKFFEDDALFDVIASMTTPGIREFFRKYVEGNTPLPYPDYFETVGIKHIPRIEKKGISLGGFNAILGAGNKIIIANNSRFDEFGTAMGYKKGDELLSFNGAVLTLNNADSIIGHLGANLKVGDPLEVKVARKNSNGGTDTLTLQSNMILSTLIELNKITIMPDATPAQQKLREAWLRRKD